MSRGKDDRDFVWDTEAKARLALKLADAAWKRDHIEETGQQVMETDEAGNITGRIIIEPREVWTPKGEVYRVDIEDGMEINEESGKWFAVLEESGEWMVNRHDNEWECVV